MAPQSESVLGQRRESLLVPSTALLSGLPFVQLRAALMAVRMEPESVLR